MQMMKSQKVTKESQNQTIKLRGRIKKIPTRMWGLQLHRNVFNQLDHVQLDIHQKCVMLADFLKAWSCH